MNVVKLVPVMSLEAHFKTLWKRYPRRDGGYGSKKVAYQSYCRHLKAGATAEDFDTALDSYTARMIRQNKVGTELVLMKTTWFCSRWNEESDSQQETILDAIERLDAL